MPKCLICNNDRDFHKLGQHVRTIHKISIEEYKEMFPGAETVSQEYSEFRSNIIKNEYKEGKMNTPDRLRQIKEFNKKGIEYKQSEEGRKEAADLQKRIWSIMSDEEKKCRLKLLESKKKEWMINNPEEFLSHQSYACSKVPIQITSIHKKVSDYLTSIGIDHLNEYYINGANVDIYIPSCNKVIECNGEAWHGNPETMSLEDMSYFQYNGYKRDERRKKLFGDSVLFLWESEILDDSFKDKLGKFLDL